MGTELRRRRAKDSSVTQCLSGMEIMSPVLKGKKKIGMVVLSW